MQSKTIKINESEDISVEIKRIGQMRACESDNVVVEAKLQLAIDDTRNIKEVIRFGKRIVLCNSYLTWN